MATNGNGNKPDLSDLKARLGLKPTKPPGSAAPPPGAAAPPGASGPPGAAGPPGAGGPPGGARPQQHAQPAPQQHQAPQQAAYQQQPAQQPVAQQPAAYQQPVQQQPVAQQPAPQAARPAGPSGPRNAPPKGVSTGPPKALRSDPVDMGPVLDVDVDETAGQASTFSPAFIGVVVGALIVGVVFGVFFQNSSHARELYDAQQTDAKGIRDRVAPKIENAKKVTKAILGLSATKPDYKAAEGMLKLDFVPDGSLFNGNRILIGSENVYNLTQFQAKAAILKEAIKQHNSLTKRDEKELTALINNSEILSGNQQFAVLYNYKQLLDHLKNKRDDKGFKPKTGRLVSLKEFKVDDNGEVTYVGLKSKKEGTWSVRGTIPLDVSNLAQAGGETALQRYEARVKYLKFYASELDKSLGDILPSLSRLADRDGAPLIQVTSGDKPAETPAEAPKE